MRVLGIDFGDKHVGLALSDQLGITVGPLDSYTLTGRHDQDGKHFLALIEKHDISEIVIGLPLRMDGTEGTRVAKTREFAAWLKNVVKKPVVFMDERLTSHQAQGVIREENVREPGKKKNREDQLAAMIILSTYLERRRFENDVRQEQEEDN